MGRRNEREFGTFCVHPIVAFSIFSGFACSRPKGPLRGLMAPPPDGLLRRNSTNAPELVRRDRTWIFRVVHRSSENLPNFLCSYLLIYESNEQSDLTMNSNPSAGLYQYVYRREWFSIRKVFNVLKFPKIGVDHPSHPQPPSISHIFLFFLYFPLFRAHTRRLN